MQLTYDNEKMQVGGPAFSIAFAGKRLREEVFVIFYYKDNELDFYFLAEREKWVDAPAEPTKRKLVDTKQYAVERMWCIDESCVARKLDIPAHLKERAKANVLSGLMLMEERCWSPPDSVTIRSE